MGIDEPEDPPKPFWLVIVTEGESPKLLDFPLKDQLVEYLRDHFKPEAGTQVQVYIFQGDRFHITQGSSKYLVNAEGKYPVPLFVPPAIAAVCKSGHWFDPEDDSPAPTGYTPYPAGAPTEGLGDDPES